MTNTDFLTTADWSREALQAMLDHARHFAEHPMGSELAGRTVALVFLNPSLRTRTSFETGIYQLGGHAVVLQPGKDAWAVEFEPGVIMDGEAEEHVSEQAAVLSQYCDLIAVRAFPKFQDWSKDREDHVIKAFARYATVPVINMETITHPCQELALMRTIQDRLGTPDGKRFLLTWTYHPKPLNTAVANSALMIATKFGMNVTLLCPNEEYLLDPHFIDTAKEYAASQGGTLTVSHDIRSAYRDTDFVYAKSWGALPYFGRWEAERSMRERYRHFMVDQDKMALTNNALFSHCLPLRRNIKATDAVMDSPACVAIEEAANRLPVQKAVMTRLLKASGDQ